MDSVGPVCDDTHRLCILRLTGRGVAGAVRNDCQWVPRQGPVFWGNCTVDANTTHDVKPVHGSFAWPAAARAIIDAAGIGGGGG